MSSASLHRRVSAIVSRGVGAGEQQSEERARALEGLAALQQQQLELPRHTAPHANDTLALVAAAAAVGAGAGGSSGAGGSASLSLQRSFRLLVQSRTVSVHRALLAEFAPVAAELRSLEASLDDSGLLAEQLAEQLRQMKVRSNELFQSSAALSAQQAQLEHKKELVHTFLTQFQLQPDDARVLNETSEDAIGEPFFVALRKITDIKRNIEAMLSGHAATAATPATTPQHLQTSPHAHSLSGSTRISIDLLDSLSKQLEVSYEKVYRSIQRQLTGQLVVKTSDLHANFITSFQLLRNVPVYFEHCSSDLVSARRSLLIERFLKALSRGTAGARPIELSAHDPVRYCSDMLAWIHQALANEKEFLCTLFPPQPPSASADAAATAAATATTDQPLVHDYQIYLSSIFEALSRPLRVRIEQSFSNVSGGTGGAAPVAAVSAATHAQIETVFKIWNILKFYRVIIEPILPATATSQQMARTPQMITPNHASTPTAGSSDLLTTLSLLSDHARLSFFQMLSVAGGRLTRAHGPSIPLPADLTPAPQVAEWLAQLSALMNIYNSALIAPAEKEEEFEAIMERVMEPLLACLGLNSPTPTAAAAADVDHLLYRINVLHGVLTVCFTFPSFVSRRIETLNFLVGQQQDLLVDQQTRLIWQTAKLDQAVQAVAAHTVGANLSSVGALSMSSLTSGIGAFYSSLLSVGAFIVPQCDRLLHTPARRHCRFSIAKRLSAQYRQLYESVMAPTSGLDVQQLQSVLVHSPAHVDLLLDIDSTSTSPANKAT